MKSHLIIALIIFANLANTNAQITLTQSDFPTSGDTLRYSITTPDQIISFQETGEDYFWDFSAIQHAEQSREDYIPINQVSVYLSYFFGTNAIAKSFAELFEDLWFDELEEIENIYRIYNKSSSVFTFDGYALIYSGIPIPMVFTDKDELYKFPFNYEQRDSTTFEGSIAIGDSIYYQTKGYRINEGDGWGEIVTPYGEFDCLRLKTTVYQKDSLYYESFGESLVAERTTIEYKWIAKGEKFPIMEITVMASENPEDETPVIIRYRDIYRSETDAPVADFAALETDVFVDDIVMFENSSTPDHALNEYIWEFTPNTVLFLDGTNENSVEPIVSFTEEGTYDVKLTVTNSAGSDELLREAYINVNDQPSVLTSLNDKFEVYPNPFNDVINIKSEIVISEIIISNLYGNILIRKDIGNRIEFSLDLNNLIEGIYIISLIAPDSSVFYKKKLIKKRGYRD